MLGSCAVWSHKKQLDLQCGITHKWMNLRLSHFTLGTTHHPAFFILSSYHWPLASEWLRLFTYRKKKCYIEVELFFLFPSKFIWREDELDSSLFFLLFPYFCLRKQTELQAFHFRRVGWFVSNLAGCIVSPTRQPELLNTVRARRQ